MSYSPTLSAAGTKFICDNFELFRSKPYLDPGGLPTIGYGTRITSAQLAEFRDGITEQLAQTMYQTYMQGLAKQLQKCPFAGFTQYQIDAIFSLSYNIGINAFQSSTIYKTLMVRGTDLTPWLLFIHDNHGNVDDGLIKRRKVELRLFIYGLYS